MTRPCVHYDRVAFRRARGAARCLGLELCYALDTQGEKNGGLYQVIGFLELVDALEVTGVKTARRAPGRAPRQSCADLYEGDLWLWGRGGEEGEGSVLYPGLDRLC